MFLAITLQTATCQSPPLVVWAGQLPAKLKSGLSAVVLDPANRTILGSVSVLTLVSLPFDQRVQDYSQTRGLLPDPLARAGDLYGGGWAYYSLLPAIAVISRVRKDPLSRTFRQLEYAWLSVGTTGVLTSWLKVATSRQRPNGKGYRSFPSGHTSGSFAVAAVVNELYGSSWGAAAYGMAAIVAVSRVHDNKHYLSDVLFGAGLGTLLGRGFAVPYRSATGKAARLHTRFVR